MDLFLGAASNYDPLEKTFSQLRGSFQGYHCPINISKIIWHDAAHGLESIPSMLNERGLGSASFLFIYLLLLLCNLFSFNIY